GFDSSTTNAIPAQLASTPDAVSGLADAADAPATPDLSSSPPSSLSQVPTPLTQPAAAPPKPEPVAPQRTFEAANVDTIVSSVRTELLPRGGTITLRLDPPELGALQVAVTIKDGIASVAFQSDNAEAVRLLTSTLANLRDTMQTAGMTVD